MVGPTESGTYANYYSYGRATLLSMQVSLEMLIKILLLFLEKISQVSQVSGITPD